MEVGIKKIKKPQDNFQLFVKKKKVPLALLLNLRQLWPEGLGEEGRFCLHYSSPWGKRVLDARRKQVWF